MSRRRTREGRDLTAITVAILRARPLLEAMAHSLGAESGLAAAGWQIASALGTEAATVPEIAARVGRRRQTVQVAVDELVAKSLAIATPNPNHRRSPKISLTELGREAFWETTDRYTAWMNDLARQWSREDLQTTARVLCELTDCLESRARRLSSPAADGGSRDASTRPNT
jgi:DNA-binding MarR family transcriptional regulator